MKPYIDHTEFGSITVDRHKFEHDIYIQLDGTIRKRKKKLSKAVFGTSHVISIEEAKYFFERNAELLVIGAGQYDQVTLSEEAAEFFKRKKCRIQSSATPLAVDTWNKSEIKKKIGLFHITC